MKNKLPFFLFTFLLLNFSLLAQDCEQSTAETYLDANNVKAKLLQSGSLWWNGSEGEYFFPHTDESVSEVSAFFAGGLWLGGYDPDGNLKIASSTYGLSNGETDFWPGPLNSVGEATANNCEYWDRFFEVNACEIEAYQLDCFDGNINGIHPNILGWPAKGNPHFFEMHGFFLPNTAAGLAPFVDINGDGIYNPIDGDYPDIKFASQAIWWVFNDNAGVHTETPNSVPLQFEIQMMAYAYGDADLDADIRNATYYDMTIINRGLEAVDSVVIGLWIDPDLGCLFDDYVGCIPEDNLAFVYNQDVLDGESDCDCWGTPTYCENIPITGIKLIQGSLNNEGEELGMSSFLVYNNSSGGIGSPFLPVTPSTPQEAYHYLSGRLINGSSMLDPDGNETSYLFTGNPSEEEEWSMCSEELGVGDRRMVIGYGSFRLGSGEVNKMTFAAVGRMGINYPCPDITNFRYTANNVLNFHGCVSPTSTEASPTADAPTVSLSPNPFNEETRLSLSDVFDQIESVMLYDLSGKLIRSYEGLSGNTLTIKKGNLSKGMYIYKMQTKYGLVNSGKMIVE